MKKTRIIAITGLFILIAAFVYAGDITAKGGNLFVTSNLSADKLFATSNVGIGITNPVAKLDVAGTGDINAGRFTGDSATYGSLWVANLNNAGPAIFAHTGNVIVNQGKVGIGTNAPGTPLHISGDGLVRRSIRLQQTTAGTLWDINNYETTAVEGAGNFGINLVGSGQKLSILASNGNVGIGTANPLAKLEVLMPAGGVNLRLDKTATNSQMTFAEAGVDKWLLYLAAADDSFTIRDADAPADRLRVDNVGDVTISKLTGTGNDYVCVDANGKLYRNDAACA